MSALIGGSLVVTGLVMLAGGGSGTLTGPLVMGLGVGILLFGKSGGRYA
jgi:hypothetical protein